MYTDHERKKMETQNKLSEAASEGTSSLRTWFNGVNLLVGTGILSIPYAFSQGGWLSSIVLFVGAIVFWYTALLLARCMDANPLIKSYPDIVGMAFGHKGRVFISIFMCLELYLTAVEFLILEGDNLDKLFPDMVFRIGSLRIEGKQTFVILTALVIMPTTWLKSLGVLAYVSAGGVFASVILAACVLWVGAVDGVGFHEKGILFDLSGIPTTISLIAFCYSGHSVLPALCNSMKHKNQFSKVLLLCFITSILSYGSMAVMGYLMYGENVESQLTLNLPIKQVATKIAIYTTIISPLTKYAVVITPVVIAIEETSNILSRRPLSILLRSCIVVSSVIIALTVPFFGYVMAFIGSFLSVTISMLLPCLCYLKIIKAARTVGLELIVIVGIIVVGVFVGVLGTYTSVKQIVIHM